MRGWLYYTIEGKTPEEFKAKLEGWLAEYKMHEGREVLGTRTETSCKVKRRESC